MIKSELFVNFKCGKNVEKFRIKENPEKYRDKVHKEH